MILCTKARPPRGIPQGTGASGGNKQSSSQRDVALHDQGQLIFLYHLNLTDSSLPYTSRLVSLEFCGNKSFSNLSEEMLKSPSYPPGSSLSRPYKRISSPVLALLKNISRAKNIAGSSRNDIHPSSRRQNKVLWGTFWS